MTEQELRAIVRDAVARHLGASSSIVQSPSSIVRRPEAADVGSADAGRWTTDDGRRSPSHAIYLNIVNVGGECVIEPGVPCNHCNYCKSHGH